MGGLTSLSAAAYGAVVGALREAYPLPLSTRQVEEASGYGVRYGTLAYRMCRRAAARGAAEQITVPDMRCAYWRFEPASEPPPGTITVPRHGPGRRPAPVDTQGVRFTIYGRRQIETWAAMCALAGRAPHELAYDIVLAAIQDAQQDHQTQHLVELLRDVTLVFGGPRSSAGRREMLSLLREENR
jgi:hypothetical protein